MIIWLIIFSSSIAFTQSLPDQDRAKETSTASQQTKSVVSDPSPSAGEPLSSDLLQRKWKEAIKDDGQKEANNHGRSLNQFEVGRFVGFIEGRLDCPCPTWWSRSLKSMAIHSKYGWQTFDVEGYKRIEVGEFSVGPQVFDGETKGDFIVLSREGKAMRLPLKLLENTRGHHNRFVSATFGKNVYYFTAYAAYCYPFTIYCADISTGNILWSTIIDEEEKNVSEQGFLYHYVELKDHGNRLCVFGYSRGVAYLNMIDRKTGRIDLRFNTRD